MGKKKNGITLIALVVTIVVLIILAAVSINVVIGENGIIKQAQEAKRKQVIAEETEIIKMAYVVCETNRITNKTPITAQKLEEEINKSKGAYVIDVGEMSKEDIPQEVILIDNGITEGNVFSIEMGENIYVIYIGKEEKPKEDRLFYFKIVGENEAVVSGIKGKFMSGIWEDTLQRIAEKGLKKPKLKDTHYMWVLDGVSDIYNGELREIEIDETKYDTIAEDEQVQIPEETWIEDENGNGSYYRVVGINMGKSTWQDGMFPEVTIKIPSSIKQIEYWGYVDFSTLEIPSSVEVISLGAFSNLHDNIINIHKTEGSITGAPWGARDVTINWLGE